MKVFLIGSMPGRHDYALFVYQGTPIPKSAPKCDVCGLEDAGLTDPLLVEWGRKFGDFAWCGYHFVVQEKVRSFMASRNYECRFSVPEIVRPRRQTKAGVRAWPYTGPPYYWCRADGLLSLNEKLSGITLDTDCEVCGRKDYSFRQTGLVFDRNDWQGQRMFEASQWQYGITFMTEEAIEELERESFTHLTYLEAGIIQ